MEYWYLLIIVPFIVALINFNHWYFFRTVIKKHALYIKGVPDNSSPEDKKSSIKASKWLTSNHSEIKRRIIKSGVGIPCKSVMEPAGYGYVASQTLNVIDNMLFPNIEILDQARRTMELAKGYYLSKARLSLSPLYWIEILFYLPKELVKVSGIEVTSNVTKFVLNIVQIIYWVVLIVASYYSFMS